MICSMLSAETRAIPRRAGAVLLSAILPRRHLAAATRSPNTRVFASPCVAIPALYRQVNDLCQAACVVVRYEGFRMSMASTPNTEEG